MRKTCFGVRCGVRGGCRRGRCSRSQRASDKWAEWGVADVAAEGGRGLVPIELYETVEVVVAPFVS